MFWSLKHMLHFTILLFSYTGFTYPAQQLHLCWNGSLQLLLRLFDFFDSRDQVHMVREKFATHAWSVNKGLVSILTDVGALFDTFYMSSTHEVMWEILILQVQWSVSTCNCLNPQSAVDVLEHKQSRCAGCVNTQLEFCDQVTWLSILGHEN